MATSDEILSRAAQVLRRRGALDLAQDLVDLCDGKDWGTPEQPSPDDNRARRAETEGQPDKVGEPTPDRGKWFAIHEHGDGLMVSILFETEELCRAARGGMGNFLGVVNTSWLQPRTLPTPTKTDPSQYEDVLQAVEQALSSGRFDRVLRRKWFGMRN